MSGIVYWKLRSQVARNTVTFDGHFVSVGELKRLIAAKLSLGPEAAEELVLTDPQNAQKEYREDTEQLPKGSYVIVKRVPPGQQRLRPLVGATPVPLAGAGTAQAVAPAQAAQAQQQQQQQPEQTADAHQDEFGADPFALQAAQLRAQQEAAQAAAAAQRQQDAAARGGLGGRGGPGGRGGGRGRGRMPHATYVCPRCNRIGQHWVGDCPTQGDPAYDVRQVRQPAGIPQGKMICNPDGSIVLPGGALGELSTNNKALQQLQMQMLGTAAEAEAQPEQVAPLALEAPPGHAAQGGVQQASTGAAPAPAAEPVPQPQEQQQQQAAAEAEQQQEAKQEAADSKPAQEQPAAPMEQKQQQQAQQQPTETSTAAAASTAALFDEDDDVLRAAAQPVKLTVAATTTASRGKSVTPEVEDEEARVRTEREQIPVDLRRPFCTPKEFLDYLPLLQEMLPAAQQQLLLKAFGAGLPLTPTEFMQLKQQHEPVQSKDGKGSSRAVIKSSRDEKGRSSRDDREKEQERSKERDRARERDRSRERSSRKRRSRSRSRSRSREKAAAAAVPPKARKAKPQDSPSANQAKPVVKGEPAPAAATATAVKTDAKATASEAVSVAGPWGLGKCQAWGSPQRAGT